VGQQLVLDRFRKASNSGTNSACRSTLHGGTG
jgi:hypothetical protein